MFHRLAPLALCALAPVAALAQQTPTIEPYIRIRAPIGASLAPDGDLYFIDSPDGVRQLFRKSTGGETLALTDLEDGVSSYALSPDGEQIVLSAAIGGSEQNDLFLLDADTGESTTIFSDPNIVYRFNFWLDDNSGFVYSANDDSANDFHLYRYDLATDKPTKLVAEEGSWSAADITPDGARALVTRYISAAEALVFEIDTKTGKLRELTVKPEEGTSFNSAVGYLPGAHEALIVTDADSEFRRLVARDLTTDAVREVLPSYADHDIDDAVLSEDGSRLAIVFNEDGYSRLRLFKTAPFEERPIPMIDRGVIGSLDFTGDTLTYSLSNARTPSTPPSRSPSRANSPSRSPQASTSRASPSPNSSPSTRSTGSRSPRSSCSPGTTAEERPSPSSSITTADRKASTAPRSTPSTSTSSIAASASCVPMCAAASATAASSTNWTTTRTAGTPCATASRPHDGSRAAASQRPGASPPWAGPTAGSCPPRPSSRAAISTAPRSMSWAS